MSPKRTASRDPRGKLPSVERLLAHERLSGDEMSRAEVVAAVRATIDAARARVATGEPAPDLDVLAEDAAGRLAGVQRRRLRPVINATGVIIHTNLGRAPLSRAARAAMDAVSAGYSNLEYDLARGERGSRGSHVEALLRRLTGAQAALVVNNNAGAVVLALSALACGRDVVISRGQLVEIGGGFRIPDVLRQSGARLVEVGTTNRTHLRDYAAAIGSETAMLLRVHASNFKQIGFTATVPLADLVALGRQAGVLVVDDLGSGVLLDTRRFGLAAEPTVMESVAAGADVVTFSGDKLLGGPQSGLIVGTADCVGRLRDHPLARALRVDKSTLAGLEATLLHYVDGRAEQEVPVWRMISAGLDSLAARAADLAARLQACGIPAVAEPAFSAIGGGSLPGEVLPTHAVSLAVEAPDRLAAALRAGIPPVVARVGDGRLHLDPRTVDPEADGLLLDAVAAACSGAHGPAISATDGG